MRNPENPKKDFSYREMEMLETLTRVPKLQNLENLKKAHHSESWIPGFRLPGDGDVRDSHQQECRNREMRNGKMI
jgi:hypothetical protein